MSYCSAFDGHRILRSLPPPPAPSSPPCRHRARVCAEVDHFLKAVSSYSNQAGSPTIRRTSNRVLGESRSSNHPGPPWCAPGQRTFLQAAPLGPLASATKNTGHRHPRARSVLQFRPSGPRSRTLRSRPPPGPPLPAFRARMVAKRRACPRPGPRRFQPLVEEPSSVWPSGLLGARSRAPNPTARPRRPNEWAGETRFKSEPAKTSPASDDPERRWPQVRACRWFPVAVGPERPLGHRGALGIGHLGDLCAGSLAVEPNAEPPRNNAFPPSNNSAAPHRPLDGPRTTSLAFQSHEAHLDKSELG